MTRDLRESDSLLLKDLIKQKGHIIENKKSDALSAKSKIDAWIEIAADFNAQRKGPEKSVKQIKTFYNNSKAKIRKDLAIHKAHGKKTGGGSSETFVDENDPLLPLVLPSVTPLPNRFDSDADFNGDADEEDTGVVFEEYLVEGEINIDGDTPENDDLDTVRNPEEFLSQQLNISQNLDPRSSIRDNLDSRASLRRRNRNRTSVNNCTLNDKQIEALNSKIAANKAKEDYYKMKMKRYAQPAIHDDQDP